MIILNIEPEGYAPPARRILESLGEVREVVCDRAALLAEVPQANVLIVRLGHRIDAEVFEHAKCLSVVVSATTGLNHIDLDAAERHGVAIVSLQGQREFLDSVTATAELTWGLTVALVRHMLPAARDVEHGGWDRDRFRGTQLSGKTLGIIGLGRLGRLVAGYARAFRMRVVYYDPAVYQTDDLATRVSFDELMSISDVVSLHASYSPENHHLVDARAFEMMKREAVFINTARGELVDEVALLHALEQGNIAGAGLDVLDAESSITCFADHPLIRFAQESNCLLVTPHIGGATFDSMRDAETFAAQLLVRHLGRTFS